MNLRTLRGLRTVEGVSTLLLLAVGLDRPRAQVVLDGKSGTSGALTGPKFSITAGMGDTRGNNLFHSFSQFNLKAGDVATFSGPANIQNIMGRVTGGSPSSIDGAIRSGIAGANLFLINPSGVIFGPNATVDVSGAFAASTANYLKLTDGAKFVAALDADDSMLSTEPVAAFGFLYGASGAIEVRGSLKVAPERTLSAVGSTVTVAEGTQLDAISGQINLIGVSAAGEVPFPPSGPAVFPGGAMIPRPGAMVRAAEPAGGGNVVIRGGRLVVDNALITAGTAGGNIAIDMTQGVDVINGGQIFTTSSESTQGGSIVINSPSVVIDGLDGALPTRIAAETSSDDPQATGGNILVHSDSLVLRRGAEISVSTFGAADAGRVEITTGSLWIEGSDMPQLPTQISANAAPVIGTATGGGGRILIRADTVDVGNGALIQAATTGDANAGSIEIDAGSINLWNGGISTYTAGVGRGGEIQVLSDHLTLDGPFSSITALTTGEGNGGFVTITAGSLRILNDAAISASTYGSGNGGFVNITAGALEIVNDAAIAASTYGTGAGGNINITADSIVLETATSQPEGISGITASSEPSIFGDGDGGKGGDITITVGSITLQNGMLISTTTDTAGDGGNIDLRAGSVTLNNGSSIQSASIGSGRAGTLLIRTTQNLLLTANSTISTSAPESSGGDIEVRAGGEIQLVDSTITAQAGPGGGGSITISSPTLVYLLNGTLTAQAAGDGGNLTVVDPVFFILNEGALISKSSTANGGNITILSDYFFQSQSVIDASAPFGLPGIVQVSAPNVDLSGSLVGLPSNLLGLETQLRPDCGVRLTGHVSSFIVLGRGGLPMEPGGFVPSGLALPSNEAR